MTTSEHDFLFEQAQARLLALGHAAESGPPALRWVWQTFRGNCLAGEFAQLPLFVPRDRTAVDLGANVGQYSLMLASLAPEVIAVDALAEHAQVRAALPASVRWHSTALGATAGTATLQIPVVNGQRVNGMASLEDLAPYGHDHCARVEVSLRRLDDLLAEVPPQHPIGFIKLDVEGHEIAVLEGATETLKRHRPNLQLELWEDRFEAGVEFLAERGYQGLFFFRGTCHAISQFRREVHCPAEHHWRPDRPFNPALCVSHFFFVPR